MRWTKQTILNELRARHARGEALSYRALARVCRPLVSAAAYHFGSFAAAIEKAGIDYRAVSARPKWTKQRIITRIKAARRAGEDLSWTAVVAPGSALRQTAYAAVLKVMFGNWPRALEAAGVDADAARRYIEWGKAEVLVELRQLHANGEPINSEAVRRAHPALHAAAVRYYNGYAHALRTAKLTRYAGRRRR